MHIVWRCPGYMMQRGLQSGPAHFKPCKSQFSSWKIMIGLSDHEYLKSNFGEEEQVLRICLPMQNLPFANFPRGEAGSSERKKLNTSRPPGKRAPSPHSRLLDLTTRCKKGNL